MYVCMYICTHACIKTMVVNQYNTFTLIVHRVFSLSLFGFGSSLYTRQHYNYNII